MTRGVDALRRPTWLDGARSLHHGFSFIASHRNSWFMAAVPGLIVLLLATLLIWASFDRFGPWLSQALLPEVSSWYARAAKALLRWVGSGFAAYLSLWFALLVTPSLSAPALEHLVRLEEEELGAPERAPSSFWFELRAGLTSQLVALALFGPPWFALWLLSFSVPVLGVLLLPVDALLAALAIAWNLLDYPLTLRRIQSRERLALLRRNLRPVLGFGLSFALLGWVPGAGLLLLPVGVVGATRLVWLIVAHEPSLLEAMRGSPPGPSGQ